jgi:hypothetical protein
MTERTATARGHETKWTRWRRVGQLTEWVRLQSGEDLIGEPTQPKSRIVGGQPNANPGEVRSNYRSKLAHQAVVNIHQLRVVIKFQDELPGSHPGLLPE